MAKYTCPYLQAEVEMTKEREDHIAVRHPDLFPEFKSKIAKTLENPDEIRRAVRSGNALLFSRWYEDVKQGKYVVIVVVADREPKKRYWIVTAYLARKIIQGEVLWKEN